MGDLLGLGQYVTTGYTTGYTTATSNTITISGGTWGTQDWSGYAPQQMQPPTVAAPPTKSAPRIGANEAWLDKRVAEMRVAL